MDQLKYEDSGGPEPEPIFSVDSASIVCRNAIHNTVQYIREDAAPEPERVRQAGMNSIEFYLTQLPVSA